MGKEDREGRRKPGYEREIANRNERRRRVGAKIA
jgi:hypothetical protein